MGRLQAGRLRTHKVRKLEGDGIFDAGPSHPPRIPSARYKSSVLMGNVLADLIHFFYFSLFLRFENKQFRVETF